MLEKKRDKLLVGGLIVVVAAIVLITLTAPAILAGSETDPLSLQNASSLEDYVVQAMIYATEYGSETALAEFNNPNSPFASSNYYIIAYDSNGTLLAMSENPALVGENQIDARDIYGVQSVMQCFIRAGHGGGYVYAISPEWFRGVDPAEISGTTISLLYILPVDDKWFVFSGGEPDGVDAAMSAEAREKLDAYIDKAVSYVKGNGLEAAVDEFNNVNGEFTADGMSLMVFNEEGELSVYQDNHAKIGEDLRGFTDTRRTSVGRDIYQMGHKGGGYLYDAIPTSVEGTDSMKFILVVKIADNQYLAGTITIGTIQYPESA